MSPTLLNHFSSTATLLASPGLPLPSTSLLCAIAHLLGALFKNMRLEWETQLLTCADEIWLLSTAEKRLLYCKQTQDERIRKKPLGSWSDIMLWQQPSVISAPCYNKQSCRSSLTNFRTHDQHERTKRATLLPCSALACSRFVVLFSGLLFNTNSNSTAMQTAVSKCASINIS